MQKSLRFIQSRLPEPPKKYADHSTQTKNTEPDPIQADSSSPSNNPLQEESTITFSISKLIQSTPCSQSKKQKIIDHHNVIPSSAKTVSFLPTAPCSSNANPKQLPPASASRTLITNLTSRPSTTAAGQTSQYVAKVPLSEEVICIQKRKSSSIKNFAKRLLCKVFSREQRFKDNVNIYGKRKGKTSIDPEGKKIKYIKETIFRMYSVP